MWLPSLLSHMEQTMNEAIENAKAVLFSGTLDSDRLRGALSVLLDDAEALERQRDAVLGDEGLMYVDIADCEHCWRVG